MPFVVKNVVYVAISKKKVIVLLGLLFFFAILSLKLDKPEIQAVLKVQWSLDKFRSGGTIKQVNLSKCEFKETWIQSFKAIKG
jgi:hypothetical protein